jgi:hypothetical protein
MKYVEPSQFADPDVAARKLVEIANAVETVQDGRLPKAEHESPQWQAATEALIMAAEGRGPLMHARIGVMRALHYHVERVFNSERKDPHWGRRKLKRDE